MSEPLNKLPRGIFNNNPGNIRLGSEPWKGKIKPNTDGSFEQFSDMTYGIRALLILLRNYISKGYNTIEKIIARYAPSNENDTIMYIISVEKHTGFDKNMPLVFTLDDMLPLIKAICRHENGGEFITNEQIEKGWEAT